MSDQDVIDRVRAALEMGAGLALGGAAAPWLAALSPVLEAAESALRDALVIRVQATTMDVFDERSNA